MKLLELEQKLNSMLKDDMRYAVGRFEDRIEEDDLLHEPKTSKVVETFLTKKEAISLTLRYASNELIDSVRRQNSSVVVQFYDILSSGNVHTFNRRIVIAECW